MGNVFTTIAIPWFVLKTSGSATQTGITGFFTILPVVLAGFFGGALIDRLGYKPTSIISDLAGGVTTALVPILYFTVGLEIWQLLVLVFLGALLDAPGSTARSALLPELAEQAGMPIERVTSLTLLHHHDKYGLHPGHEGNEPQASSQQLVVDLEQFLLGCMPGEFSQSAFGRRVG